MTEANLPAASTPAEIEVTSPLICGMHDWAYCDHGPDGETRVHVYGTCHLPPHGTSSRHVERYRKPDGTIGLWAEFAGLSDPLPTDVPRCDHARPRGPVYLDKAGQVVDAPPEPECDNTFRREPCVLGKDHGGKVHRDQHGTEWGMHLPFNDPVFDPPEPLLTLTVTAGDKPGPTIGDISRGMQIGEQRDIDKQGVLLAMSDRLKWASVHWGVEGIHPEMWSPLAEAIIDSDWFKWASGQTGCCSACKGTGIGPEGCSDCLNTGHCHSEDTPCRTPWARA